MPGRNKELVRRFLEWWVGGDMSVVDETAADDMVTHTPRGDAFSGREAIKERLAGLVAIFEERELSIVDIFGEEGRVAVRYAWSGVTKNKRPVRMTNLAIYRIEGGRIAEEWEAQDTAGMTKQLERE